MSDALATGPYQHCRPLTDEEYAALKADIEENGIKEYVHVDEAGEILVGHHRARAAAELGIEYPRHVVMGLSEREKHEYAVRLESLGRARDITTKQYTAESLWRAGLKLQQAHIASLVGVSTHTMVEWVKAWKAADATKAAAVTEIEGFNFDPPKPERAENARGEMRPTSYQPRRPKAKPDPEAPAVVGDVMGEIADELEASGAFERVEAEKQARRARSIRLTLLEIVSTYPPGVLAEGLDSDELGQLVADLDALLAWTEQAKQVTQQARRPRRMEA